MPPGASTTPHYHPRTEEIYYVVEGTGRMQVGDELREVRPGDAVAIPPGVVMGVLAAAALSIALAASALVASGMPGKGPAALAGRDVSGCQRTGHAPAGQA